MIAVEQFNLRHLRAVCAVVERGTISAAADAVALSQPALTQGIAKVERMVQTTLFDRRSTGMIPTAAGAALGARVAAAARLLSDAIRSTRARGTMRGFARADLLVTMAHLRALIALVRDGSYLAAARSLGVSQPAVHRAVRDLEALTGLVLIERRGKGVAPTAIGQRFARASRLALAEIGAGLDEIASVVGQERGRIAIGAMPLARAWLLPSAIARFHAAEPGIAFDVAEGSHAELIEPLRDGEFDLLVGAIREPSPGPDVTQRALFVDRLAIVARADHPLAGASAVSIEMLAGEPWLAPRVDTPLRAVWEAIFEDAGLAAPVAWMESGSVMLLRGMMLKGDYLTLLSPDQLLPELRSGLLATIDIALPPPERSIGVTTRTDWRPTSAQAAFLQVLRATADGYRINPIE